MSEREHFRGQADLPGLIPEETRELEKKKEVPVVVRVLVSRSKSLATVSEEYQNRKSSADLKSVKLTAMKWIEKDETSVNPNQAMPIGGNVEIGETIEEAGKRKLLQETHLRAINFKQLGEMDYEFWHTGERKKLARHAIFMSAEIAPSDWAYSISPVNKIKATHDFDLDEHKTLFEEGEIQAAPNTKVNLLDSLTDEKGKPIKEVILRDLEQKEARKKTKVLKLLLSLMQKNGELDKGAVYHWLDQIKLCWFKNREGTELADYQKLEDVWRNFWDIFKDHKRMIGLFWQAIDLSNFEEEIEGERAGVSKLEARLHLLLSFLESRFKNDQYLEIAAKNSNLKEMVNALKKFLRKFGNQGDSFEKRLEALGEELSGDPKERRRVVEKFMEVFGLNEQETPDLMDKIDGFLGSMHRQSIKVNLAHKEGDKKTVETLEYKFADQHDDIKGQTMDKLGLLLAAAFPTGRASIKAAFGGFEGGEDVWRESFKAFGGKKEKREHLRSFSFEARRKLALMILFKPFIKYYEQAKSLSSSEVMQKEVFSHFVSQPIAKCAVDYEYDKDGNLSDAKVVIGPQVLGQPDLRRTNDKKYFLKMEQVDPKTLNSFLRKLIVRGWDDPTKMTDLFRGSIILAGTCEEKDSSKLHTRVDRKMNFSERLFDRKDDDEKDCEVKEINEIEGVADVLEYTLRSNPDVRIIKYKPTPLAGEKIVSSGPGGGAPVRFAKCTVELEKDGILHQKELHIFSGEKEEGDKIRNAFFFRREKEIDDSSYKQKRLFDTNTFRSFVELMYPAAIYGPAARVIVAKIKGK